MCLFQHSLHLLSLKDGAWRLRFGDLWYQTVQMWVNYGHIAILNWLEFSSSCQRPDSIWSAVAPVCAQFTCQKVLEKLESAELCALHQLVLRALQLDLLYHWIAAWIFSFMTSLITNSWVVFSSLLGSGPRSTLLLSHHCQLALTFSHFLLWCQIEISDLEVEYPAFC